MADTSLLSVVDESLQLRIYGKPVDDITLSAAAGSQYAAELDTKSLSFAWIYGVKLAGLCKRLPHPVIAVVPGNGKPASGCDEFPSSAGYLMWELPKNGPLAVLRYEVGTASEVVDKLLAPRLTVDHDFHIYDVHLSGTKVVGRVRAYLRLRQSTPFGEIKIVVIDRDDPFSIDLIPDLCITVFSIGVASLQICFHNNPNRVCGEARIDIDTPIGGIHQSFPIACVNV